MCSVCIVCRPSNGSRLAGESQVYSGGTYVNSSPHIIGFGLVIVALGSIVTMACLLLITQAGQLMRIRIDKHVLPQLREAELFPSFCYLLKYANCDFVDSIIYKYIHIYRERERQRERCLALLANTDDMLMAIGLLLDCPFIAQRVPCHAPGPFTHAFMRGDPLSTGNQYAIAG